MKSFNRWKRFSAQDFLKYADNINVTSVISVGRIYDGTLLISNPNLSNTKQYNIGLDCLELDLLGLVIIELKEKYLHLKPQQP